eukprot:TRINITY_DN41607_c0_g1_i1.p1 TRINITY_DN41607_c0_g1~~TRINITY_DN41607_c0_g1_i1.p1  ORF type:complete len:108 (-),score=20.50 TRINITY_DN41607_c0_g1_i1:34-357(-)
MLWVKLLFSSLFLLSFSQATSAGTFQQGQLESGLIRLRRAAQIIGAETVGFGARFRNRYSGGSEKSNSGISTNVLGSDAKPTKQCRWKLNRKYRLYFLVDETGACCD